jgi:TPR repeat protein
MAGKTNKKRIMALFKLKKRAESGTAEDWLNLARAYESGDYNTPQPELAREALERAAAMGSAAAKAGLGIE